MDIGDREKLVAAFNHMVENVGNTIREAEAALAPSVEEMVHNAEVLARELFALTQEEAESLGRSLIRDIHKANQTLNHQRKEISDWFSFDLKLVEDRFIDLIAQAADKTWLDFRDFENEDHQASLYHSGEICNAGRFCCQQCDQDIDLTGPGLLPPCPACGHTDFHRVIS